MSDWQAESAVTAFHPFILPFAIALSLSSSPSWVSHLSSLWRLTVSWPDATLTGVRGRATEAKSRVLELENDVRQRKTSTRQKGDHDQPTKIHTYCVRGCKDHYLVHKYIFGRWVGWGSWHIVVYCSLFKTLKNVLLSIDKGEALQAPNGTILAT